MTRYRKATSFKWNAIAAGIGSARSGMNIINELVSFFKNIGSILVALFGGVSLLPSGSGSGLSAANMPISLKFMLILLAGAATGWGLGFVTTQLMRQMDQTRSIVIYFASIVLALALTGWVEWLAAGGPKNLPDLQIFAAIGLCSAVWVAAQKLGMEAERTSGTVIERRNGALAIFVAVAVLVLGFVVTVGSR